MAVLDDEFGLQVDGNFEPFVVLNDGFGPQVGINEWFCLLKVNAPA